MELVLTDAENPERQFTITKADVKKFRSVILDEHRREAPNASKVTRQNSLFVKATWAVETLDKAGFWAEQLDAHDKYSVVVWMSRMLCGLKKKYENQRPAFIEVF